MWPLVWGLLGFVMLGVIVFLPRMLIDLAIERKGAWLEAIKFVNGFCVFIAVVAGGCVLFQGVPPLWEQYWQASLVAAGALAFVIYFYVAKIDAQSEAQRKNDLTPKTAETIVRQYGAALARGTPEGHIARSESFLPCSKGKIKQAFKLVLAFEVEHRSLNQENAKQLLGAIMYLDSFVPDDKADHINQGAGSPLQPNTEYWDFTKTMVSIEIRREMEEFIEQVQGLDAGDPLFHQRIYTLIGLPYSPRIEKVYWDD